VKGDIHGWWHETLFLPHFWTAKIVKLFNKITWRETSGFCFLSKSFGRGLRRGGYYYDRLCVACCRVIRVLPRINAHDTLIGLLLPIREPLTFFKLHSLYTPCNNVLYIGTPSLENLEFHHKCRNCKIILALCFDYTTFKTHASTLQILISRAKPHLFFFI
jgi:hypothetical protein